MTVKHIIINQNLSLSKIFHLNQKLHSVYDNISFKIDRLGKTALLFIMHFWVLTDSVIITTNEKKKISRKLT